QASLLEGAADEFVWMESGKIVGRTRELKRPESRGERAGGDLAGGNLTGEKLRCPHPPASPPPRCSRASPWSGDRRTPSTPCCFFLCWWWSCSVFRSILAPKNRGRLPAAWSGWRSCSRR